MLQDNDAKAAASQVAYISDVASWDFSAATGTTATAYNSGTLPAVAAAAAAPAVAASNGTVSPFSNSSTPLGSPEKLSRAGTPELPAVAEQEQQPKQQQAGRLEPSGDRPLSAVPAAGKRSGRFTVYEGAYEGPEDEAAAAAAAEQSRREHQLTAHQMLVRQRSISSPNLRTGRAAARAAAAKVEDEASIPHLDLEGEAAAGGGGGVAASAAAVKAAGVLGQKDQRREQEQIGSGSPSRSPRKEVRKQISFDVPEQREAAQLAAAVAAAADGDSNGLESPGSPVAVPGDVKIASPGAVAAERDGPRVSRDSAGLGDMSREPSVSPLLVEGSAKSGEQQQQAGVSPLSSPSRSPRGPVQAAKGTAASEPLLARPGLSLSATEPCLARPGLHLAGVGAGDIHHKPCRSGSPLKMWDQLCDSLKDIGKALHHPHHGIPHGTGTGSGSSATSALGAAGGSYTGSADGSSSSARSALAGAGSGGGSSTSVLSGRPPRAGGGLESGGASGPLVGILGGLGKPPKSQPSSRTATPLRSHTPEGASAAAAAPGAAAAQPAVAPEGMPEGPVEGHVGHHVHFTAAPVAAGGVGSGNDVRVMDEGGIPPSRATPSTPNTTLAVGAAAGPKLLAMQHSIDAPQSATRDQRDQGAMSPAPKPEVAVESAGEEPGAAIDEELYQQQQWEQAVAAGTVPVVFEGKEGARTPSPSAVKKKGRFVIRED